MIMSIVLRISILLVVAAAFIIVRPNCAYACSCRPPGTPVEELNQSDAVFLGRVVEVNAARGSITGSGDSTTVTFDVSKVWKGQITRTSILVTPGSSASCGVTFEQGKDYVVYGRMNEGSLNTNLCSRTRLAGEATEDIAALGAGQPIDATSQMPGQLPATGTNVFDGGQSLALIIGLLAIVLGLVIIAISRQGSLHRNQ
jgi:hypothetical protein